MQPLGKGYWEKSGLWRAEVTMSGIQKRNDAHHRLQQKERICSKLSRAVLGIVKGVRKEQRRQKMKEKSVTRGKKANKNQLWKKKGSDGWSEEGKECNRKLLSELTMASSQSFQTRRNSRQKAGSEGRCQEGGRHRMRRAGRTCGLLSKKRALQERGGVHA